jgi:cytochrome c oxidase subunit II
MKRSVIFLLSLTLAGLTTSTARLVGQETEPKPQPRVIAISAKTFEYTPNQVTLKRGEPVTFRVSSQDRAHGFFQKELGLELDLTTDHATEVTITPQTAGRFVVICDHFCGSGHGNMKMVITVE